MFLRGYCTNEACVGKLFQVLVFKIPSSTPQKKQQYLSRRLITERLIQSQCFKTKQRKNTIITVPFLLSPITLTSCIHNAWRYQFRQKHKRLKWVLNRRQFILKALKKTLRLVPFLKEPLALSHSVHYAKVSSQMSLLPGNLPNLLRLS